MDGQTDRLTGSLQKVQGHRAEFTAWLLPPKWTAGGNVSAVAFIRLTIAIQIYNKWGIGKMRKCGMRNAESKMRNAKCGMHVRNGV